MEIKDFKFCHLTQALTNSTDTGGPLFADFLAQSESKKGSSIKINILHMNDIHGNVEPMPEPSLSKDRPVGGLATAVGIINAQRACNPGGTLLLNAGDIAEGSMVSYFTKGKAVSAPLSTMGFDATALGNHDFAWGQEELHNMMNELKSPIVTANVVRTDTGGVMNGAVPWIMKELKGVKIAVIGLDTPEMPKYVDRKKLDGLKFLEPEGVVKKYMEEVKGKGADMVIVLSHLGFDRDRELARNVPGIDAIVGGHTHTELKEGHREGKTIIVQAGALTRFVGNLEISWNPAEKRIIETRASLIPIIAGETKPDQKIQAILAPYLKQVEKIGNQPMGTATEDLHHYHRSAGKLNQIHADSLLEASGADLCICNSRTLRGNVKRGNVTMKELYSALPFTEENLVILKATGKIIKERIEDTLKDDARSIAVPAGLTYSYNPNLPNGERVVTITWQGKPLKMDREYTVATNETMAKGSVFSNLRYEIKGPVQPLFFEKFKKGSPWKDDPDQRIKITQ